VIGVRGGHTKRAGAEAEGQNIRQTGRKRWWIWRSGGSSCATASRCGERKENLNATRRICARNGSITRLAKVTASLRLSRCS